MTSKRTPSKDLDTPDTLRAITTWQEAAEYATRLTGHEVETVASYGEGFEQVEKDELVGVPHFIIEWREVSGTYGVFVVVKAITESNRKVLYVDGSTGIQAQLRAIADEREANNSPAPQTGLMVGGGLKLSTYTAVVDGKDTPARTYYLT